MNISITLPDEIAVHLESRWKDLSRRALEALVVDAYRNGIISSAETQRILGLESRWDVEELLQAKQAYLGYSEKDLEQDLDALRSHPST